MLCHGIWNFLQRAFCLQICFSQPGARTRTARSSGIQPHYSVGPCWPSCQCPGGGLYLSRLLFWCATSELFAGLCLGNSSGSPLLTVIGGMCYSIYLLHYTVIMAAASLTKRMLHNS